MSAKCRFCKKPFVWAVPLRDHELACSSNPEFMQSIRDSFAAPSPVATPEDCARLLELSASQIRLMAGEMTAAEMRAVKAVLANRATAIRELASRSAPASPPGPAGTGEVAETCELCEGRKVVTELPDAVRVSCPWCDGSGRSPTTRPERQNDAALGCGDSTKVEK